MSQSLNSTVNCLPGLREVDQAVRGMTIISQRLMHPQYPQTNRSFQEIQIQLNNSAVNLNQVLLLPNIYAESVIFFRPADKNLDKGPHSNNLFLVSIHKYHFSALCNHKKELCLNVGHVKYILLSLPFTNLFMISILC